MKWPPPRRVTKADLMWGIFVIIGLQVALITVLMVALMMVWGRP